MMDKSTTILSFLIVPFLQQIWISHPILSFTIPLVVSIHRTPDQTTQSLTFPSNGERRSRQQISFPRLENMNNDDLLEDNDDTDTNNDDVMEVDTVVTSNHVDDDDTDTDDIEVITNDNSSSTTPTLDPIVVELQEQIKNIEAQIKGKKSMLERIQDDLEKYSKTGYARQVAQMEDMKRIRLSMQSSNKDASQANVVQNFLIIWDELTELKHDNTDESSSSFGIKYHGLVDSFASTMRQLGVESYDAIVGETMDPIRVTIVEREFSDLYPPNTIIHSSKPGLELRGNVLRLAQAIVSKGPEAILEPPKESMVSDDA